MTLSYFRRLRAETPTRVWVNNPTLREVDLAIAQGAVGCTTNPSFAGGLLRRDPSAVGQAIDDAATGPWSPAEGAERVQLALVGAIAERFRPIWIASGGQAGFVSSQGSPDVDDDAAAILAEARRARERGPNVTPKIPATLAGLQAFETLVAEGSPTIVTEVFSLAQLVDANERYLRVSAATGERPPFFMSPITGIFGDHLRAAAVRAGTDVDPALLGLAGVALTRSCYRLCVERSYPVVLLAGGARSAFDLTGLVGARLHATINWSTFAQLLAMPADPVDTFHTPIDPDALAALEQAFAEFADAFRLDALAPEQFAGFGPVRYFRGLFVGGWRATEEAVAAARAGGGVAAGLSPR